LLLIEIRISGTVNADASVIIQLPFIITYVCIYISVHACTCKHTFDTAMYILKEYVKKPGIVTKVHPVQMVQTGVNFHKQLLAEVFFL
jgi:hypothetical protein